MSLTPEPNPPSRAPEGICRVLVVDDNLANRELLEGYLSASDDLPIEVAAVADGFAALDHLQREATHLVLLDVMMPRLSGYQVCERIKSNPQTAGIPVVMITALNEEGDVERAREAGADGFLTKPVGRAELVDEIRPFVDRVVGGRPG